MIGIDHKSWPQILDEFERSLEWHEEQLATAESGTAPSWANPWAPPAEAGAVPDELRTRAQRLLERAGELELAIMEKMASVSPNGTTIQRRRTHQTQHASSTFSTQL
ncbi:MAG: hypothetical protein R2733_26295 [Acidimicrobiales bacterium]